MFSFHLNYYNTCNCTDITFTSSYKQNVPTAQCITTECFHWITCVSFVAKPEHAVKPFSTTLSTYTFGRTFYWNSDSEEFFIFLGVRTWMYDDINRLKTKKKTLKGIVSNVELQPKQKIYHKNVYRLKCLYLAYYRIPKISVTTCTV